jgi:hypothetical protein
MTTVMKSQTNNCSNGIGNLCCPSKVEQNGVPKKIVKVIDPLNREMNGKGPLKSLPPPIGNSNSNSDSNTPADFFSKMKIVEDESSAHGIKLTDVGLPHISVQTLECKKNEKPQTTIIIYKSKNGNRAPTAKVIMTKVLNFNTIFSIFVHSSFCYLLSVTDTI